MKSWIRKANLTKIIPVTRSSKFVPLNQLSLTKKYDEYGNTLLHYAAKTNSIVLARYLIEHGCNVNKQNRNLKDPPLKYAIECNDMNMVKLLLDAGAIHCHSHFSWYIGPLHISVKNGNYDMTKYLIDYGCDINAVEIFNGNTVMEVAIDGNFLDIIELLIASGFDLENKNDENTPFEYAVAHNADIKTIEFLLEKGFDVGTINQYDFPLLCHAIEHENVHLARRLIELGTRLDLNSKRSYFSGTFVHYAFLHLKPNIMRLLIEDCGLSATVSNKDDLDPLSYCLGQYRALGAFYNKWDKTTEQKRIYEIDKKLRLFECIDLVLSHGADINRKNKEFRTPLTVALKNRSTPKSVIQFLLDRGAKLDFDDEIVLEVLKKPDKSKKPLILIRHAALFEAQNRTDGPLNFDRDLLNAERQNDYVRCRDELELMRTTYSFGSMSLYKLLIGKVVGPYARNDRLAAAFESREIERRFPIYEDILKRRYAEEKEKLELVPGAVKSLGRILGCHVDAQPIVFDKIVYYLDKDDLRNVTNI